MWVEFILCMLLSCMTVVMCWQIVFACYEVRKHKKMKKIISSLDALDQRDPQGMSKKDAD